MVYYIYIYPCGSPFMDSWSTMSLVTWKPLFFSQKKILVGIMIIFFFSLYRMCPVSAQI